MRTYHFLTGECRYVNHTNNNSIYMPNTPRKQPIRVIVSLDVEEEGLFSGRYATQDCKVENVNLLPKLAPLSHDLGFPLTLLCAYTVLTSVKACKVLAHMRDAAGAEIGAHLHHWSTPPRDPHGQDGPPERSDAMDQDLLRQRLRSLLNVGRDFQGTPLTSFRMGRWDLKARVRPMLAEEGILVDSSVSPLRAFANGPDHFLAPTDPYWVPCPDSCKLLEVPITQVAWLPALARAWYAMGKALPATMRPKVIDSFKFFGAMSANPVWHSLPVMRAATRTHIARGGKVISLFWHSSEMLAGASPNTPNQAAAEALLAKIHTYLVWLRDSYDVQGVTLSSLYNDPVAATFPTFPSTTLSPHSHTGDW